MRRPLDSDAGCGDAVAEEDDGPVAEERGPADEGLHHGGKLAGDDLGLAAVERLQPPQGHLDRRLLDSAVGEQEDRPGARNSLCARLVAGVGVDDRRP
eukprot:10421660-Lingulodinium_polyedra.AAC.1